MVISNVPAQSIGRGSGAAAQAAEERVCQTMISVTAAKGMLMKKIARHEMVCTSQPPSSGPAIIASEVSADQDPIALPRSPEGKAAAIMARLPGTRQAPPIPCSERAAI